jgi:hypothetical protein
LVADLFRGQAVDPLVSRAQALRAAMVPMIDRGGYTDETGIQQTFRDVCVTSALPPKADITECDWNVRYGPEADIG